MRIRIRCVARFCVKEIVHVLREAASIVYKCASIHAVSPNPKVVELALLLLPVFTV
jgi:hypothetical protein